MRLFFAVLIPDEIVSGLTESQERLKKIGSSPGLAWTRPDQFHFTLRFLGEQKLGGLHRAIEAASGIVGALEPFDLTLSGLGAFPDDNRPSVLWLGVQSGVPELTRLVEGVDALISRAGMMQDRKPFKAHLTLARVKSYAAEEAAARILRLNRENEVQHSFKVDTIYLMQSILKPQGAEYSIVERFSLAGAE